MNNENTNPIDDMKPEYELAGKGERGKFYQQLQGADFVEMPVSFRADVLAHLLTAVARRGDSLDALVNELLSKEIAIAEALRG